MAINNRANVASSDMSEIVGQLSVEHGLRTIAGIISFVPELASCNSGEDAQLDDFHSTELAPSEQVLD